MDGMSQNIPDTALPTEDDEQSSKAVLTEAARQVDIIHTSLAGMFGIVIMLLFALSLPVFGRQPLANPFFFTVMTVASFVGIGVLYYLNFGVHKHLSEQAGLNEVLVNSLGQGFLTFDIAGKCGAFYSQAVKSLLEINPANKNIVDVLKVPEDQKEDFQEWISVLFQPDHALSFSDVVQFLPSYYQHSEGRRIKLDYRPIKGKDDKLRNVVLIATDQSEEFAAQKLAEERQNYAEMIFRVSRERNQFVATLAHLRDFLAQAEKAGVGIKDSDNLLRQLHTLKAAVKQFNLLKLGDTIHNLENELRDAGQINEKTFVEKLCEGKKRIITEMNIVLEEVKELMGSELEYRGSVREIDENQIYEFARDMHRANTDQNLMQAYIKKIVAVPIKECFQSFARELQELSGVLDKQVKPLKFVGDNPLVLALPLQEFLFSLTHIARNIMDHGIEPPVTRMAREKDPAGLVTIAVKILEEPDGNILAIDISDDGNGIDPTKVRAKLASMDPNGIWQNEDNKTVIQRIFSWGFTTTEQLTDISGRGVGMEVVEREVKLLGGTIYVVSEIYKGTTFEIRIPYSLDINQITFE